MAELPAGGRVSFAPSMQSPDTKRFGYHGPPVPGHCMVRVGQGRGLRLSREQKQALLDDGDAVIVGWYADCTVGTSGDVALQDGRWLKLDGTLTT